MLNKGYFLLEKDTLLWLLENVSSPSIRVVFLLLYYYNFKQRIAFPSQEILVSRLKISRKTLFNCLKELEDNGLITAHRKNRNNFYQINITGNSLQIPKKINKIKLTELEIDKIFKELF